MEPGNRSGCGAVPERMNMTLRPRLLGLVAALALVATGVSCSGGLGDSVDSDPAPTSANGSIAKEAPMPGAGQRFDGSDEGASDSALGGRARAATQMVPRSVISTGNVALRSKDVGEARFEVQKIVDHYRGEITQEQTDTDDKGVVRRSRLVLRIPTAQFSDAMQDLEKAADLISSDTATEDVTTQVIDLKVRLGVQRRSIERIELLFARAQSIRDIMAIEAQLSRRQAVLGSLERQQAYLADQTTMSTITVSLERTHPQAAAAKEKDNTGFVPGLRAGWNGLTAVAVALATVVGAALPFTAVLLVLALLAWPILRQLRRMPPTDSAPTSGPGPAPLEG